MVTEIVLSLLLAALTGTAPTADAKGGINPVQHSEAASSPNTTTDNSRGINPVQHSE